MKKILIAFLMSIISLGSITTPTFADEATLLAAAERFTNNRANKPKPTHVQNCNATLKKTKDIVGTGSTAANAEKEWRTNAKLFLKQYCINPPQKDTYVSCNSTGGGAIMNCNDTCGDAKEINRFAREICQNILVQTKKDDPGIKFDQFDSSVPAVVTTQDNTYDYIARLKGSTAMPDVTITKSAATPAQPTASITGKVIDEYGEPAMAYVYLQQNNKDLKNSKGNLVVASTSFNDGSFEIPGYTWEPGYSLRINTMGQDMIIHYNDQHDLNTPIIFKLPEDENVNMIKDVDIANTLSNKPCCVPATCENCERNTQCSCTQDEYNQDICNNTDGIRDPVDSGHGPTCRPTKCIQPWFDITLQPGTNGAYYTCELAKSKLGESCETDLTKFDPHATDGTIVEWDEKTGDVTQCTSTECEKGFGIINTSSTYIDKNGLSQKIQLCEQTTCPKELIKGYNEPHAKEWAVDEKENHLAKTCRIIECDSDNGWDPSRLTPTKCVRTNQCTCGTHWAWPDEHPQQQEGCIPNDGVRDCAKEKIGAETAHYGCDSKGKTTCIIDTCLKGWKLNENKSKPEKNICINQLDCLNWGKENDSDKYANATVASWDDDKHTTCIIKACDNMYRVDKSSNTCVIKNDEDIGKLTEARDKARENEKSLQNRINGAVGIGGVGIGGMMIGGALSENAADDDAELAMRAYINTFKCDYGTGTTVRGGTTNVEIPGGNELIDLYARYATLANDLKLRKTSLGIKPGIESEVIIDKASTGLYDDVGTGVVGGGYASIARAIMNPTGADAQMWAAQRAATTSKLNTGIGIATTAAALTLGKTIADEFTKPKDAIQNAQQAIQEIPNKEPTCSDFDLEGTYPNCTCKEQNHKFVGGDIICQECGNGQQIVVDSNTGWQKCECPNGYWSTRFNSCRQEHLTCEEQGFNTNNVPHLKVHMTSDGVCRFSCGTYNLIGDETDPNADHSCECPNDGEHQDTGEKCIQVQTINNENISIYEKKDLKLDSETFFAFSDHKLKDQNAKDVLTNFAKDIVDDSTVQSCIMIIYGHTDKAGDDYSNERLATRRIASVTDVFNKVDKFKDKVHIIEKPVGEKECKCAAQDDDHPTTPAPDPFGACEGKNIGDTTFDKNYAPCRHVDIDVECKTNQLNKI